MIKKALKYVKIMLNPIAFEKNRAKLQASVKMKDRQIKALLGKIESKDKRIETLRYRTEMKDRQIEVLVSAIKSSRRVSDDILSERFQADGRPTMELSTSQVEIKDHIDTKISKGTYQFEKIPCCICAGRDFEALSEKDRYGLYSPVVICRDCGLVQANPRMTREAYQQFYETEYSKLYRGIDYQLDYHFSRSYDRGRRIYDYIAQNLRTQLNRSKVLEVGSSSGGILQHFKEQGNQVCGCDLDPEAVEFGKEKHNLDLQVGTVYDVTLSWKPDIVIYSHTLEHILDPVEELMKVRSIMGENAILYVEAPGIACMFKECEFDLLKYFQNAHAYYFTLTTLQNLLRKTGFDLINGDEYIHSVFRVSTGAQQNGKIENDYEEAVKFLRMFEDVWKETAMSPKLQSHPSSLARDFKGD